MRSLVLLHGGSVEVHSDGLGKGCELIVRLPMSAAGAIGSGAPDSAPRPAEQRACRVLVADDNADAADSLGMLLRLLGAEVDVVYNGEQALIACGARRPELVFLDIGMPGLDGCETARRMRALDCGRGVTLVAVTGWGQEEDRRRVREAGFDQHLVKPVDAAQLRRLLAEHSVAGSHRVAAGTQSSSSSSSSSS